MQLISYVFIFALLLISLLANPAPISIEKADLILILLPSLLALLPLFTRYRYKLYHIERQLMIAVLFYLSFLLISFFIGFMDGVPILNVLRSTGPYLDFFPLIFLCLLPKRSLNPWIVATLLIAVGLMQASYEFYLYFKHSYHIANTADVLRGRITLLEPRTTLPLTLAAAIIPFAYFVSPKSHFKLIASLLMFFSLFASAATLTRSVILSILFGWLNFLVIYTYYRSQQRNFSPSAMLTKFIFYSSLFLIGVGLASFIPKIHMLEEGLIARFFHRSASAAKDYSNGRLYDEWIPALKVWFNADFLNFFFGIGAGKTFVVANGEERTYIHNLAIYSLVYGGIYGLFACLGLYLITFKTFVTRALQTKQIIYLSFAALLASLFFYGQLFAVHKGLAFNAMLFLMIAIALIDPEST